MRATIVLAAFVAGTALPSAAEEIDDYGVRNPQELTIDYFARKAQEPGFKPDMCRYGYWAAKEGDAAQARRIFERCAEEGNLGSMPWMSWLEENGYDRPSDPKAAADWDRRAAEAGYAIGELNYGLDLLRGHGVEADEDAARRLIDSAADKGEPTARRLRDNGYDWQAVTPDADEDRYRKRMY